MGFGPIVSMLSTGLSALGMFKQDKAQKKATKEAKPKSAEELEAEARKKAEQERLRRQAGKEKYGKTSFASPTGIAGQMMGGPGLKQKLGE